MMENLLEVYTFTLVHSSWYRIDWAVTWILGVIVSAVSDNAGKLDALKWLVALAVLVAGLYANAEYAALTLLYRVLAGIVIAGVFVAIALTTVQGRATWDLAKEARVEIRKVVWPTRQETTQTTLIVVVMVIFVGLILWALDSTLSWSVSGLIG